MGNMNFTKQSEKPVWQVRKKEHIWGRKEGTILHPSSLSFLIQMYLIYCSAKHLFCSADT